MTDPKPVNVKPAPTGFSKWMRGCLTTLASGGLDYVCRFLFWTCRFDIKGKEHFEKMAQEGPVVLMFWHDRIFAVLPILMCMTRLIRYSAFVSASRDGILLQKLCRRYKECEVIPVPHDRRHQALRMMIQCLTEQKRVILLTPDGPQGPRHILKPGLFFAARKTGAPVIAMSWSASSYWQLRSWDKMAIPKPFSRITVHFSPSVVLEPEQEANGLQELLDSVTEMA